MLNKQTVINGLCVVLLLILGFYFFKDSIMDNHENEQQHNHEQEAEFEKGKHNGRMLRKDNFSLELTIFEKNTPPQFRVFAYDNNKQIDPAEVDLKIELKRLEGNIDKFTFVPQDTMLIGQEIINEPHSFDVSVTVKYNEKAYQWNFPSYEGRVKIDEKIAEKSGIRTEKVHSATIHHTIPLTGKIVVNPKAITNVTARFAGIIKSIHKEFGESVKAGDVLATVQSNDSLQIYSVIAPISGFITNKNANIGEFAGTTPLFTITNLSNLWGEFHVFHRDLDKIKVGQSIAIEDIEGTKHSVGKINSILPITESENQTVIARVIINNTDGHWYAGMTVHGDVTVLKKQVPKAVKINGLQKFRDFTVVFAKINNIYEVRMLDLGIQDSNYAEVLDGISLGTDYVTDNSFLIRADIEKSSASHDH